MSIARKSGHTTILQVTARALCAFRYKAAGGGRVHPVAHEVRHGPWETDEAVGEALKTLVGDVGCANDRVLTVLPRHDVTARIMEFPSHDDEELAGMVRLGAEDLVPYPADELVTAHNILERQDDGSSRVLVAVVHQDTLNRNMALVREAGLEPDRVLWSTACLITAIQSAQSDRDDVRALLHIGPDGFEMLVIRGVTPEYTRGMADDFMWTGETSPDTVTELASELRTSLTAHRRESLDGAGATEVFVSSDVTDVDRVTARLAEEVDYLCEPANFAREAIGAGSETITGIPLVSWGAALTAQGSRACAIDLTPQKELEKRARASVKTKVIRSAVAVAALLISLSVLYFQAVHQRTDYIAKLEQEVEALRPGVQMAVNKRRHLERLQRQVERKDTVLELLSSLSAIAPRDGLNFANIRFLRDEGITLNGRARSLQHIQDMTEALRAIGQQSIPHFAKASINYENPAKERDKEVYDYQIDIPFPEEVLP